MSKTEKPNEEEIFKQELDDDELKAVSGGNGDSGENEDCDGLWWRDIEGGSGFPNCASTVEEEESCMFNDACDLTVTAYYNLETCDLALR